MAAIGPRGEEMQADGRGVPFQGGTPGELCNQPRQSVCPGEAAVSASRVGVATGKGDYATHLCGGVL